MKKSIIIAGFGMLATFPCLGGEVIAHWDFDSVHNGRFIKDIAGSADAQFMDQQSEAIFEPGLSGNALLFEAGPSFLQIAADQAPDLVDDFTIRAVIMPYQVHSFRTIFWKGDRTRNPEAINYYLGLRDGKVELKYKDASGAWIIFSVQTAVEAEQWLDIYLYHNGETVEAWLNGKKQAVLRSRTEAEDFRMIPNDAPAQIGVTENSTHGRDFWFYGLLDELVIYRGRFPMDERRARSEFEERLMDYDDRKVAFDESRKGETAEEDGKLKERYRTLHKEVAKGGSLAVRAGSSARRFERRDRLDDLLKYTSDGIVLSAAKGEAESMQVFVAAGLDVDLEAVSLQCSPLARDGGGELATETMSWGWIRPVTTERPGIPVDYVGEIPDVIMEGTPQFRVARGSFEAALLRYVIPKDAAAGIYRGSLRVVSKGGEVTLPVELKVYDFALPERGTLKVAFSFFERYYCQWYGKEALSAKEKLGLYRFLLSYRIPPSNIYTKDAVYPDMQSLKELGSQINFLTIAGWGERAVSEKEIEHRIGNYRETLNELNGLGMLDYAYFYGVDEIAGHLEGGLPGAKQAHDALSKSFPKLGMMQTSFPYPEIRELFNVWVPLVEFFGMPERRETIEEMREKGNEIWWYVADTPLHPYPNFFLDYPVYDSRVFGVLSWMYQVEGILYWSINREWLTNMEARNVWPNGDWKPYIYHISQGTRKQRNGMGNLIYPGPEGKVYASLRLENFRDGIEDYEYIAVLKRSITAYEIKETKDSSLLERAQKLLTVPPEVAKAANDYNADPIALVKYRAEVAEMIEVLQKD